MKKYVVYLEFFGKKMKTTVHATDENEAKRKIMGKIIFHKIEYDDKNIFDYLDAISDILGGKKK